MNLEEFKIEDLDQLTQVQPKDWDDIRPHFLTYLDSPYCQALKVLHNDELIGVGAIIYHHNTVWLAHVIVHDDHRNKGIGRQLTSGLIEAIDRDKFPSIYLIATDLGYPVYLKVGFRLAGTYNHLKLQQAINETPTPIHVESYQSEYYNEIVAMDRLISGEDRTTFIAPYLNECLVWKKAKVICGVYFPTMYDGYIIAMNQDAGLALLTERAKKYDYAILPTENQLGLQHLLSMGYELSSFSRRMMIGTSPTWHPNLIYNRISGQIG